MEKSMRDESVEVIKENWGEDIAEKICETSNKEFKEIEMKDFLKHCTAMGGNWGGMLLTGMRELYPETYDIVPENMGVNALSCIFHTLMLCGVYNEVGDDRI